MTNEIIKSKIEISDKESLVEKFFSTKGRIDRLTYFKRNFVLLAAELVLLFVIAIIGTVADRVLAETPTWLDASLSVLLLISLVPVYFLDVKRLHDLGKDSTLAKIFLGVGILSVAYDMTSPLTASFEPVGIILSLATIVFTAYLLFKKGEDKVNQYGEVQ